MNTNETALESEDQIRRMGKRALADYCIRLQEMQEAQKKELLSQKEAALTALSKDCEEKIKQEKQQHEKEMLSLQSAFQDRMRAREEELSKQEEETAAARKKEAEEAAEKAKEETQELQKQLQDLQSQKEALSQELAALKKEMAEKDAQLAESKKALSDRAIRLEKAGTIAEAAFDLNNVLTDAQNAAKQYLDSMETESYCENLLEKTKAACAQKEQETEDACRAREEKAQRTLEELRQKVQEVLNARSGLDSFLSGIDGEN